MEKQRRHRHTTGLRGRVRQGTRALGCIVALGLAALTSSPSLNGAPPQHERHTREYFRQEMAASVRPDHPAIVPVAAAIRAVSANPLEQLVMVNDVTHLLVDYDDDERVYGTPEFHATLEEMLRRRREGGWLYLRDDCDGRAVFAAHLLAALGIEWRLEASFWKEHAWVIARVRGVDYDLLDLRKNAPEIDRLSYKLVGRFFVAPSRRPPPFAWRRAWAERTGRDLRMGLALGVLSTDSTPGNLHQRFATDWSQKSPGGATSPLDERTRTTAIAGFPYGEPLQVRASAGQAIAKTGGSGLSLGVATGSPTSAPADSSAK